MNLPTPQERQAMRNLYATPAKQPTKLFKVRSCGRVVFENESPQLCWHYIRTNSLKTKPTLK